MPDGIVSQPLKRLNRIYGIIKPDGTFHLVLILTVTILLLLLSELSQM